MVTASLGFFLPPEGAPAVYRPGVALRDEAVSLRDGRPGAAAGDLDREGFVLRRWPSAFAAFDDRSAIAEAYCPEVERAVCALAGASAAVAFDFTVRLNAAERAAGVQVPARRVHGDFTERSGPHFAAKALARAGLAAERLAGRYAIVNVWRPIGGPVKDCPLALCDARSVALEDFIETQLATAAGGSDSYSFRFNPAQRWYFFPEMRPDEIVLIKVFESARDGRARFVPHGSFRDPRAPADAPPRQSIETRVLALFD